MTREEKLQRLANQYAEEFAGQGYPNEFKAHGTMTECNFGGKMIILSDDGDSCIVWGDWSDTAVSDKLEEFEIDYREDEDSEIDEEGNKELVSGFVMHQGTKNETFYSLDNFARI